MQGSGWDPHHRVSTLITNTYEATDLIIGPASMAEFFKKSASLVYSLKDNFDKYSMNGTAEVDGDAPLP